MRIGHTFSDELFAAGVSLEGLSWDSESGVIIASDSADHLSAAEAVLAKHDPTKTSPPFLTGQDVIDVLSPAQARDDAVDPRDLLRIQGQHPADTVKSKIVRVEKALGLAAGTLLKQATPTGGL